jgi:carbamoyl-phosphate synthase large subunit
VSSAPGSTIVLVTSGGSLVGKVVLDCLDGRRHDDHRGSLRLVACNSLEGEPQLARFDEVHQMPVTDSPQWAAAMAALVERLAPDVVIAGRDEDVAALAALAGEVPALERAFLGGSAAMATTFLDKAETAEFARRHGLAFADTVATDAPDAAAAAAGLLARHGFPLVAKPVRGCGSRGVKILTVPGHLQATLAIPGLVVQPFLDSPGPIDLCLDSGIPLFFDVPEDRLHAVQYAIDRDGRVLGRVAHRARMVRGRCEALWRMDDPELLAMADAVAAAAVAEGWRGPLNVQAKRAAGGGWQTIELNGRFSGGTSARLLLGFDEVTILVNCWVGREVVRPATCLPVRHVERVLHDVPCND